MFSYKKNGHWDNFYNYSTPIFQTEFGLQPHYYSYLEVMS